MRVFSPMMDGPRTALLTISAPACTVTRRPKVDASSTRPATLGVISSNTWSLAASMSIGLPVSIHQPVWM